MNVTGVNKIRTSHCHHKNSADISVTMAHHFKFLKYNYTDVKSF